MGNQWVIDLSGLNPDSIKAAEAVQWTPRRVVFAASDSGGKTIEITNMSRAAQRPARYYNTGNFVVENKVKGEELAAALKHAVELCKQ